MLRDRPPSHEPLEPGAWPVPLLHPGEPVFCVGAGPSLRDIDPEVKAGLARRTTIVCNEAQLWLPSAPYWLFYDWRMIELHEQRIRDYAAAGGEAITPNRRIKSRLGDAVRLVPIVREDGLARDPRGLASGGNTGHGAVNLAFHFGASPIVLVGYDMRRARGGWSHWNRHNHSAAWRYCDVFRPRFKQIAVDLAAAGVTVLNATEGSALEWFERADLASLV